MLKLGIPSENIKELVNKDADRVDIEAAVKKWITRSVKQEESDISFFLKHGLATDDGKQMFLLPYDGALS